MIAITGATGHLGRLVVEELIRRGAKPNEIVALVRDQEKAAEVLPKGVELRLADYTRPETLAKAFQGVERVLLISGTDLENRVKQHANVIEAAEAAGVKFVAYTSIVNADKSQMMLAKDHLKTEKLLEASGLNYALLRNSWYIENYSGLLGAYLEHGAIQGATKNGKISAASRADYAAAAAAVLLDPKQEKVFELAGPAFTLQELASTITRIKGKEVHSQDISADELIAVYKEMGLPRPVAEMLADSDLGIARGELYSESEDLKYLIGRPLARMEDIIKKAQ